MLEPAGANCGSQFIREEANAFNEDALAEKTIRE
jgi:hypothetical protein